MGGFYVLHWPLYTSHPYARFLCASVPLAATVVFVVVGLGIVRFQALVDSSTRRGAPAELLTGPVLYGLVHTTLAVVFWSKSLSGVLAAAVLCYGDGAAELVGRHATRRLPYNRSKTWAGSVACLVAGTTAAALYAWAFLRAAPLKRPVPWRDALHGSLLCGTVGALVESLPLPGDNLWVPLATVLTARWWFGL